MKHIVCFHHFNDYSGSPKVLKVVLEGLLEKGYRVDLVTSSGGVLDELIGKPGFRKHGYRYRFSTNPFRTMGRYMWVQLYTFLLAWRWLFEKEVVFYINTLLPVGPALAGRLMGKRVVYHYHENAFVKSVFYEGLAWMMQHLAHEIVCVSAYQASFLKRKERVVVIPNALPSSFVSRLRPDPEAAFGRKRILMLGSLKRYKGALEFMELAKRLPQFTFELVVNDTQASIDQFLEQHRLSACENLTIFPRQADVVPFYNRASLVLNLSNKALFVETFGLTALEAMSAGLPVIVPTAGGIAEMVTDGVNGYQIDVDQLDEIVRKMEELLTQPALYVQMAEQAIRSSRKYNSEEMMRRIEKLLLFNPC